MLNSKLPKKDSSYLNFKNKQCSKKNSQMQNSEIFQKNLIANSKFAESKVMFPYNNGQNQCSSCKILANKLNQLIYIREQVNYLRQKNVELHEHMELLSSNFKYILELVSQNIQKNIKAKIRSIVKQKQNIIQKKDNVIQKLEAQLQEIINQINLNAQSKGTIEQLEIKIKYLQQQNEKLRNLNRKYNMLISIKNPANQLNKLKSIKDNYDNDSKTKDYSHQSSQNTKTKQNDLINLNLNNRTNFKLKKKNTFQRESEEQNSELRHINSLQNLRFKLNNMKEQMERSIY